MKKLVFILIAFITFNSVNAQDGPSKKETFEFIVQLLDNMDKGRFEGGSAMPSDMVKQSVTEFDADNLTLTYVSKFSMEAATYTNYFDFTRLKSLSRSASDGNNDYQLILKFKNDMRYDCSDGIYHELDFSETRDEFALYFDTKENKKKIVKAFEHLIKLLKGSGSSLFDD